MKIDSYIDECIRKLISFKKEPLYIENIPEELRGEKIFNEYYDWNIIRKDHTSEIDELQKKIPIKFPMSYYSLLSRYCFLGFRLKNIFLYGNTGKKLNYDLETRLFSDKIMSPFLLNNGFLQIGNPEPGNYDPVCFDISRCKKGFKEPQIVQLDHEAILCKSQLKILCKISSSFIELLEKAVVITNN